MALIDESVADVRGKVRTRDADTSWKAAEITVEGWGKVKAVVLAILTESGPLTHDGIYAAYRGAGGARTPQRIRTATKELQLAGLVRPSNVIGLSDHGGDSQMWEVTAA